MKEEIQLKEKIKLLEQELITLTEKIDASQKAIRDIADLQKDIQGLKLFLGRAYPDFKTKYPEIIRKIYKKK
jgi:hypothetical protein